MAARPWPLGAVLLLSGGCSPPAQPLPDPPNSITPVRAELTRATGPLRRCSEAPMTAAGSPLLEVEVEVDACVAEPVERTAED